MNTLREPLLRPLDAARASRVDAMRKAVDTERIRADLLKLPAPRSRLFAPEAMVKAEEIIQAELSSSGWPAEKHAFSFRHVLGIADNSPKIKFRPTIYRNLEGANIVAVKEGIDHPEKAVVVLAHYDTVRNSLGADDNTASMAALFELARVLKGRKFRYSVILAMPDMEELWFIGAKALVKDLLPSCEILGVINFETMGFTANESGSQLIPSGLGLFYGQQVERIRQNGYRGNFTCFIYNGPAENMASLLASALDHLAGRGTSMLLRDPNDIPLFGKAIKNILPAAHNFSRSDHVIFWKKGVAAVQVTDTANYRYPHYHRATDTPEKIDYQRVADIVAATGLVVSEKAGLIDEDKL